jgi:glycine/D-amino acid oxidase-like deaminating enzyme
MSLNEKSYWLDTLAIPRTGAAQPVPEAVGVAVMGAGFTGLLAVLALSGAKVAVLEAESIGGGPSSRNGGKVLAGLRLDAPGLIEECGRDAAVRMHRASLAINRFSCSISPCEHLPGALTV